MFGCRAVQTQNASVVVQLKRIFQVPRPPGSVAKVIVPRDVLCFETWTLAIVLSRGTAKVMEAKTSVKKAQAPNMTFSGGWRSDAIINVMSKFLVVVSYRE